MDPQWAAESNLARILALTGIIHLLALTSLGLRLYARVGLLRTPGRDDVAVVGASVLALGGWMCFVVQGYYGLGRHTITISKEHYKIYEKISFVQSIVSAIGALGLLKISIALFLLRLSQNRWYSRSLWAMIVFIAAYTVGAWLTFLLRCRPLEGYWDHDIGASCYNIHLFKAFAMANTAFNISTDILSASLPIPIIWNLQMSHRTRASLIGVLSLGYLAVGMGVAKTIYQLAFAASRDRTFDVSIQFWGFMQLNIGIIAANIPTMRPLLRRTFGTTTGDRYNQFNDVNRLPHATIGSAPKTPRSGKGFFTSIYADVDEANYEMTKNARDRDRQRLAASSPSRDVQIYTVDADRTGSEERILSHSAEDSKHIKCTTEVVVNNVKKDDLS